MADSFEADSFDVVVLGAGSGGYACALRAAPARPVGGRARKGGVGGTCPHVGCIPTNALLPAAQNEALGEAHLALAGRPLHAHS